MDNDDMKIESELSEYVGKRFESPRGVKFAVVGWTPALNDQPEHLLVLLNGRKPGWESAVLASALEKCVEIDR